MASSTDSSQHGNAQPDGGDAPKYDWKYWSGQLDDAGKTFEKPIERGEKTVTAYEDERKSGGDLNRRMNLFHADITTLEAMLYGQIPKVDVSRRYADADDDVGRVASMIMQRLLNNDLEDNGNEFSSMMRSVLQDWLIPGNGVARVMYEAITEKTTVKAINSEGDEVDVDTINIIDQDAKTVYMHWRDVRWGWCRNFSDMPWLAYCSYLTKEEAEDRFPGKCSNMQFEDQKKNAEKSGDEDPDQNSKTPKAKVWEIWCKKTRKVYWYNEDCRSILDIKDDPLELNGFYPSPPFLIANATTSLYMFKPDYYYAQDLYSAIDTLQTRITLITDAIRAAGVYDKASGTAIGRLMNNTSENELIPVDNWAVFAENGGLQGSIEWMPVRELSEVLTNLTVQQQQSISKLHQVTGMSDVMRGAGTNQGAVSATERSIQSKYNSVRIQARQDEIARFATDLLQLKAEVISRFYTPETILARSNINATQDGKYATQAVELIQDPAKAQMRIAIKSDSMAMVDYAVLKQERTEFIQSLGFFIQSAQTMPKELAPGMLKLLQWGLAGFKGSNEIEGVVDDMITDYEKQLKNPPQQPPNPEKIKAEVKMKELVAKHQMDMQKLQTQFKMDMAKMQADGQKTMTEEQMQAYFNGIEEQTKSANKINEIILQGQIQAKNTRGADNG